MGNSFGVYEAPIRGLLGLNLPLNWPKGRLTPCQRRLNTDLTYNQVIPRKYNIHKDSHVSVKSEAQH
jgi:hypothetical protein